IRLFRMQHARQGTGRTRRSKPSSGVGIENAALPGPFGEHACRGSTTRNRGSAAALLLLPSKPPTKCRHIESSEIPIVTIRVPLPQQRNNIAAVGTDGVFGETALEPEMSFVMVEYLLGGVGQRIAPRHTVAVRVCC